VLQDVISSNQKGFLPGRYIGENTRMVYDIMQYLQGKKQEGMIMLIDFEKAFDSLEWHYIDEVLKVYKSGEEFKRWCKVLYTNSNSCVINGGNFSKFFTLERGCRQGDPLSPYLFILAIEPLARAIENSDNIKGIKVKDKTYKLGQYADDTFLLLNGSTESLEGATNLLNMFYRCSGLKTNVEKTQVAWLGSKTQSLDRLQPHVKMKWVNSFCLLGIKFNADLDEMVKINFEPKFMEIEALLKEYQKRKLSLLGKVTVIKSLAIPKLVHLFSVLPSPPQDMIIRLEKLLKNFLWNQGKVRISNKQLQQPVENGGVKLTNTKKLIDSLRISWIKRLLKDQGSWQELFKEVITQDYRQIWELDLTSLKKLAKRQTNIFWKEVIESWSRFRSLSDPCEYLWYPIWNSFFLKAKGIIHNKKYLQENGLNYIKDLFNEKGTILGYQEFIEKFRVNVNFVDFYSLMHCLKQDWKHQADIKNLGKGKIMECIEKITQVKKVCKYIYSIMASEDTMLNNNEIKWSKLGFTIEQDEWKKYYNLPYIATIESKLRSFQYHILKRSLITNTFLYMCHITDSNLCEFCKSEPETLEHLFFDCTVVKLFWKDIAAHMPKDIPLMKYWSKKNVLLGVLNIEKANVLNHVYLLIKRFIYIRRCLKMHLCVNTFLRFVQKHYNLEEIIALQKDKTSQHDLKWRHIATMFQG